MTHPFFLEKNGQGLFVCAWNVRDRRWNGYFVMPKKRSASTVTANWKKTFAIIFTGQIFSILTTSMVQFSIIWHLTEKACITI